MQFEMFRGELNAMKVLGIRVIELSGILESKDKVFPNENAIEII